MNATNNCYASYVPVTATGVGVDDPDRAFDYEMSMAASAERENFPAKMTMSFTGNMIPMANGFRIWPYGLEYNPPSAFSLKAANAPTATTWTPLLNVMEQTYTALQWKYYVMFSEPGYYKAYQMEMTASADDLAYIYELQFLVCNMGSQTIRTTSRRTVITPASAQSISSPLSLASPPARVLLGFLPDSRFLLVV